MDLLNLMGETSEPPKPINKMNRHELIEYSKINGEEVTRYFLELISKLEVQIINLEHKNMEIAKELAKEVAKNYE